MVWIKNKTEKIYFEQNGQYSSNFTGKFEGKYAFGAQFFVDNIFLTAERA